MASIGSVGRSSAGRHQSAVAENDDEPVITFKRKAVESRVNTWLDHPHHPSLGPLPARQKPPLSRSDQKIFEYAINVLTNAPGASAVRGWEPPRLPLPPRTSTGKKTDDVQWESAKRWLEDTHARLDAVRARIEAVRNSSAAPGPDVLQSLLNDIQTLPATNPHQRTTAVGDLPSARGDALSDFLDARMHVQMPALDLTLPMLKTISDQAALVPDGFAVTLRNEVVRYANKLLAAHYERITSTYGNYDSSDSNASIRPASAAASVSATPSTAIDVPLHPVGSGLSSELGPPAVTTGPSSPSMETAGQVLDAFVAFFDSLPRGSLTFSHSRSGPQLLTVFGQVPSPDVARTAGVLRCLRRLFADHTEMEFVTAPERVARLRLPKVALHESLPLADELLNCYESAVVTGRVDMEDTADELMKLHGFMKEHYQAMMTALPPVPDSVALLQSMNRFERARKPRDVVAERLTNPQEMSNVS